MSAMHALNLNMDLNGDVDLNVNRAHGSEYVRKLNTGSSTLEFEVECNLHPNFNITS